MANKTFNTRVKNKRDTAANWEAVATTFQPLDGELIIVDTSAGKTRFKVGRYDTAKGRLLYYNEIPFADEYLYNDLNEAQGKIYDEIKDTVSYNAQTDITDEQKAQARTNIGAISSSEVSSNYLSLDNTQVLTEIQQDVLKNKLGYINRLKVLSNWVEATEQCKKESGCVLVIQGGKHNDGDIIPNIAEDAYPLLLIPGRVRGTNLYFHGTDAYGNNNYLCSISYPSFKFNVTKLGMDQQTMSADPTEDMQIATKKYVDNAAVQSDWNQNDTTAKDYIKNRICYGETGDDKTYTLTPNKSSSTYTWDFINGDIPLILGQSATVKSFGGNSSTFTGTVTQDSDGKLCIDAMSVIPIIIYSNTATYNSSWVNNAGISSVTVTISSTVVHQIDPKYIPDIQKQTLTNGGMTLTCDPNIINDNHSFKIINANNEESRLILDEKSIVLFTDPNSTGPGLSSIIFDNGEISNVYTKVLQDGQYSLTNTSFNINAHSNLNIISNSNTSIQAGSNKIITIGELASTNNKVNLLASNINIQGNKLAIYSSATTNIVATLNGKEIATKEYVDDQITTVNNQLGGLTGAMHFIGKAAVDITDGSTTDPQIANYTTKEKGDVILGKDDHKEFVWNGSVWEELGDEGSYALKTTTINGKDLSDNITLTASDVGAASASTIETMQAAIDSKPSAADAVYTATAESTDGVAYTATVSGIDSLTVGASFIMVPNKASTSKAPTLNVNGLGAKPIRRRLSSLTTSLQQGYSTNWIALNKPFTVVYDGTAWVIEGLTKTDGADVYGAVAQATADAKGNNIADTYATIAMLQSLLPKVTTITLTSNWVGDASPYYQDIALSCVTETSIVDLQPTPEQLNSWQDDGIAFTTLSGNGTVRVYVAGGKPSSAISVQVRVQEVTVI